MLFGWLILFLCVCSLFAGLSWKTDFNLSETDRLNKDSIKKNSSTVHHYFKIPIKIFIFARNIMHMCQLDRRALLFSVFTKKYTNTDSQWTPSMQLYWYSVALYPSVLPSAGHDTVSSLAASAPSPSALFVCLHFHANKQQQMSSQRQKNN